MISDSDSRKVDLRQSLEDRRKKRGRPRKEDLRTPEPEPLSDLTPEEAEAFATRGRAIESGIQAYISGWAEISKGKCADLGLAFEHFKGGLISFFMLLAAKYGVDSDYAEEFGTVAGAASLFAVSRMKSVREGSKQDEDPPANGTGGAGARQVNAPIIPRA